MAIGMQLWPRRYSTAQCMAVRDQAVYSMM